MAFLCVSAESMKIEAGLESLDRIRITGYDRQIEIKLWKVKGEFKPV